MHAGISECMQRTLIAVDVDGTLYDGADVAIEAVEALRQAHEHGNLVVIVTGRRWEQLGHVIPTILAFCDRAVCEEGGVLVHLADHSLTLLAEPVEPALVNGLQAAGVPSLDVGHVVIGAPSGHLERVTKVRDDLGSTRVIIANKGSITLAPSGCDKGSGLRAAVTDLGAQDVPIMAIGDAANDLVMFELATIAVGVANADAAVRASGVTLTQASVGRGVAEALRHFLPGLPPA